MHFLSYGKIFLQNVLEIVGGVFLLTLLYYWNILSDAVFSFLLLFLLLGSVFVHSFQIGKRSSQKGFLEGLKYGILWVSLLLVGCSFWNAWEIKMIYYDGLFLISSFLGGICGNYKKRSLS